MKTKMLVLGLCGLMLAASGSFAKSVNGYSARVSVQGELEKSRDSSNSKKGKTTTKTKTETQFYELQITVANTVKKQGSFDLEWYFFNRPLDKEGDKGDMKLCDQGKTTLTIGGMKRVKHSVKSKEVTKKESKSNTTSNKKNKSSKSSKSITGAVYGGYVVLVRVEGQVVAKYASEKKLSSDKIIKSLSQD